jgi:hypothetical protein
MKPVTALKTWAAIVSQERENTDGICSYFAIASLLPPRFGPRQKTWEKGINQGGINYTSLLDQYKARGIVDYGSLTLRVEDLTSSDFLAEIETFLNLGGVAGIVLSEPSRLSNKSHAFSLRGPVENGLVGSFDTSQGFPIRAITIEDALKRAARSPDRENVTLVYKGENWPK